MPKISVSARRALAAARRQQILDAAIHVFAEKGFDRATIADIARVAGIAEGSIYNYFKNKGDLLVSIPRRALQLPIQAIHTQIRDAAPDDLPPPEEMLTLVARAMITAVCQNKHIFRILISAIPAMSQATRDKYMRHVVLYVLQTLETYFRAQIRRGVFRQDLNPATLSRAFVGMFFPFVMLSEVLNIESSPRWDYDQLIAEIVPLFLRGALATAVSQRARKRKVD